MFSRCNTSVRGGGDGCRGHDHHSHYILMLRKTGELEKKKKNRRVSGGVVVAYFLLLALALPRRFPESSFSFVCLAAAFCCRKDEATGDERRTTNRNQNWSWSDCPYFNHSVPLEALPFVLRLQRLAVHVLASAFRLSTSTATALLHC